MQNSILHRAVPFVQESSDRSQELWTIFVFRWQGRERLIPVRVLDRLMGTICHHLSGVIPAFTALERVVTDCRYNRMHEFEGQSKVFGKQLIITAEWIQSEVPEIYSCLFSYLTISVLRAQIWNSAQTSPKVKWYNKLQHINFWHITFFYANIVIN